MQRRTRGRSSFVSLLTAALIGGSASAQGGLDDPWPVWGRTIQRIANTTTVGPQAPRIDWSLQWDSSQGDSIVRPSPVMDREGRIVVVREDIGFGVIDSYARSAIVDVIDHGNISASPSLHNNVLFGSTTSHDKVLFAADAVTGRTIWTFQRELAFDCSPVIDDNVVYFQDRDPVAYANRASDGEPIWETDLNDQVGLISPALVPRIVVTMSRNHDLVGLDPADGEILWMHETNRDLRGAPVIHDNRVYVASWDHYLYALDLQTGEEIWRFDTEELNSGSVAVGHDGTIYTGIHGNLGRLYAVSPEGEELWRFDTPGRIRQSPVVGGDGTIYVSLANSSPREGWVIALNADGTQKWLLEMPDMCWSSPMLAPDGTLYVLCRDKNLYAFKDPNEVATLSNLQITAGSIVEGDLTKITAADDDYLVLQSQFGFSALEPNIIEFSARGTPTMQEFRFINIELEGKLNNPGGLVQIWLRNWNTNQFNQIVEYGLGTKEFRGWSYQHDADIYAHPVAEWVDVKVRQSVIATFAATGFESFIDYLEVEVVE